MTAAMNGIALHGGFIPYGGTFLTFSDYARNAVRMAALMHQRVILVYSHDSIGLGEDGPTHQPIEHLNSLRLIPNLTLWRPADAAETAVAWCARDRTRQRPDLPGAHAPGTAAARARCGRASTASAAAATCWLDCQGAPQCLVIATGSEVQIALEAVQRAQAQGKRVRLVSMPCTQLFDAQDAAYREAVLPAAVTARVAVEAGPTGLWWRYVGTAGRVIGIDHFGASGKGPELLKKFGFTADNVERAIHESIARG